MDRHPPVAVRDYPPGCIRLPREDPSNGGSALDRADCRLADNFSALDARGQFLERRRLYNALLNYYQSLKSRNEYLGRRPDLIAMKTMNEEQTSSEFKELGTVPGVEVGDTFNYRSEMFVLGLHRMSQGGISWIGDGDDKIASSVVASGGYGDDVDCGETLEYTGQGGNDYKGDKKQVHDQVLQGGNLALANSHRLRTPVRVFRGHGVEKNSVWNKIYSYDGLYTVEKKTETSGASGHIVYIFQLKRLPHQPPLRSKKVAFYCA